MPPLWADQVWQSREILSEMIYKLIVQKMATYKGNSPGTGCVIKRPSHKTNWSNLTDKQKGCIFGKKTRLNTNSAAFPTPALLFPTLRTLQGKIFAKNQFFDEDQKHGHLFLLHIAIKFRFYEITNYNLHRSLCFLNLNLAIYFT